MSRLAQCVPSICLFCWFILRPRYLSLQMHSPSYKCRSFTVSLSAYHLFWSCKGYTPEITADYCWKPGSHFIVSPEPYLLLLHSASSGETGGDTGFSDLSFFLWKPSCDWKAFLFPMLPPLGLLLDLAVQVYAKLSRGQIASWNLTPTNCSQPLFPTGSWYRILAYFCRWMKTFISSTISWKSRKPNQITPSSSDSPFGLSLQLYP